MPRKGWLHFAIAGACLMCSIPAVAQTSNATLQGTVTDTRGGVMSGVTVKLESPATGLRRSVQTNHAGVYVLNFLPAGA